MADYLERDKVLDDSEIITVNTREYNSIEVVPVEYLASLPAVQLKTVDDVVVFNLERHNIKRAYPDFTEGEVAAYKKGFEECRTLVLDMVMKYCPDDDGTCSKLGADLRELLDDIEAVEIKEDMAENDD